MRPHPVGQSCSPCTYAWHLSGGQLGHHFGLQLLSAGILFLRLSLPLANLPIQMAIWHIMLCYLLAAHHSSNRYSSNDQGGMPNTYAEHLCRRGCAGVCRQVVTSRPKTTILYSTVGRTPMPNKCDQGYAERGMPNTYALWLPCGCHVASLWLLCGCSGCSCDCSEAALWLLCGQSLLAALWLPRLSCGCSVAALWLLCGRPVAAL
jgi:hypothetical protein